MRKEETKLPLGIDPMTVYATWDHPNVSPPELLELVSAFSNDARDKVDTWKTTVSITK